jgi:hypothetical protein
MFINFIPLLKLDTSSFFLAKATAWLPLEGGGELRCDSNDSAR